MSADTLTPAPATEPNPSEAPLHALLHRALEEHGGEPFLDSPILTSEDLELSDELTLDESVGALLLFLFEHAGLDIELKLEASQPDDDDDMALFWITTRQSSSTHESHRCVLWLTGLDGKQCHVGYDPTEVDRTGLLGSAAMLVALVYRIAQGDDLRDGAPDFALTQVYGLCLGFGPLLLDASAYTDVRDSGQAGPEGGYSMTLLHSLGPLGPEQLSYLQGLQLVLRGAPGATGQRIHGHLLPNHAELVNRSFGSLAPRRDELCAAFDLPVSIASTTDRRPHDVEIDLERLHIVSTAATLVTVLAEGRRQRHSDLKTFRVPRGSTMEIALAGATVGILTAVLLVAQHPVVAAVVAVAGFLIVGRIGASRAWFQCSEEDCRARLAEEDLRCPGCGGEVVGEIAHPNERLAAREALEVEETEAADQLTN